MPTWQSQKPGRDPRDELPAPILRTDVLELKDLKPGMELSGTVRNVIDFGVLWISVCIRTAWCISRRFATNISVTRRRSFRSVTW